MRRPSVWGDPHDIVSDIAAADGILRSGPWRLDAYRITASQRITVATHDLDSELLDPPPAVSRRLRQFEGCSDVPHPSMAALRKWAGYPVHFHCRCSACYQSHLAIGSAQQPGWLGEYLVDRRLIATALLLPSPTAKLVRVALYPPRTGSGGPIRLSGQGWWAIVMGLEEHDSQDTCPRFELD